MNLSRHVDVVLIRCKVTREQVQIRICSFLDLRRVILGRFSAVHAKRHFAQLSCFMFFQKTSFKRCFACFTDLGRLPLL